MAKVPVNKYQQPFIGQATGIPSGIKTKKIALDTKKYISLATKDWLKSEWYWFMLPLALVLINAILNITKVYPNWWLYLVAVLGGLGFWLFRLLQFTATTQVEQNKPMFDKYVYEFDNRQIFVWKNRDKKEGGQILWNMILGVRKDKDAYIFSLGKYQYLYMPYDAFNSDHDLKMLDTLLTRKELLTK